MWLSARLSLFYLASFTVIGVHMPFWPVWLEARGLDAGRIGLVLSAGILTKSLVVPLFAHVADRLGERRRPMIVLAALAFGAFALFAAADGFVAILAVTLLFNALWPALMPLAENLTMLSAVNHGLDYGRIRLWGSLAFILAAAAAGRILEGAPVDLIFQLIQGAIALTIAAAFLLPDPRPPRAGPALETLRALLVNRPFLWLLLAATAIQSSHAVYYAFGTLHWRAAGHSEGVIGALWAEGVIAEIALFAVGARLLARFSPHRLLAVGAIAALVRWTLTGASDSLPLLVLVQPLHALTFGATHLGAMHLIARMIPANQSATAQSLYSGLTMGLGLGLAIFLAGRLYEVAGGLTYVAMGLLGGAGLPALGALVRQTSATERRPPNPHPTS